MQYCHKTCATSPGPGPIVRWPTSGAPLGSQSLSVVDVHVVLGLHAPGLGVGGDIVLRAPLVRLLLQVAEPAPRLFIPLDLLLELRALQLEPHAQLGLHKILNDIVSLRASRLYCTIIFFVNTPFIVQYIAQYYQLLHPPPKFDVFLRCL